jgi:hypothetical protein
MDSQFFRIPTQPNYYFGTTPYEAQRTAYKTAVSQRNTYPTPDSRFPGWAAPMEDGRLVTDYRPHCSENVPAGVQFPVKEWITKNAEEIIQVSRTRQAMMAGAQYGDDPSVVPPPESIVKCDKVECAFFPTQSMNGIGTERVYDKAPELFGTFDLPRQKAPRANIGLNRVFENGRNSPRGRDFTPMGNKPVGQTEHLY